MREKMRYKGICKLIMALCLLLCPATMAAQYETTDSIMAAIDSMYHAMPVDVPEIIDTADVSETPAVVKKQPKVKAKRDWTTWRPNPQKALWLALVIPGGGQIYNRKYWKLPIVYGGFMGCIYAMQWNNMMYRDYSKAYVDLVDNDPNTASYNQFLHLGREITPENAKAYSEIFKSRKDRYRRWRDLSFFCLIGVYAISVIDAYVDAELSEFDLSKDLSLKVRPAVMGPGIGMVDTRSLQSTSLGVNCSLNF